MILILMLINMDINCCLQANSLTKPHTTEIKLRGVHFSCEKCVYKCSLPCYHTFLAWAHGGEVCYPMTRAAYIKTYIYRRSIFFMGTNKVVRICV